MFCWNEFRLTDISDALRSQMCSVAAVTASASGGDGGAVYISQNVKGQCCLYILYTHAPAMYV